MSASTIARWNAIPLSREEDNSGLKRARPEGNDDDDDGDGDDISLISRSPSPSVAMDVDSNDIAKYDEYIRGAPREVITVDTKIKPTNKGFTMLAKLGWTEGQPLGLSADGRVDPVPFQIKLDSTGIGKVNQDVRMIETTVSQRRGLDSERQIKETDDQRKAREDQVARKSALQNEISSTLKAFYCTLCDKQFKTVAQYDEHTNSYAHHHKARFKDMQANVRLKPKDEVDKRKEKERKREEKELRKMAAANGIRIPKPSATIIPAAELAASTSMDIDSNPAEPKRTGWASISSPDQAVQKKSGWATVGPSTSNPFPPPSEPLQPPPPGSQGPPPPEPTSTNITPHTTSFRTGGWTSLDTGSSHAVPLPPSSNPPLNPPPPTSERGGWSPVKPSETNPTREFHPPPAVSSTNPPTAQPVTSAQTGWKKFQSKGSYRK